MPKVENSNRARIAGFDNAGSGGGATIRMILAPMGSYCYIERISIVSDSGTDATFYLGRQADDSVIDFTNSPLMDVAEYNPAVYVVGGEALIIRVLGMTPGDKSTVNVQYRRPREIKRPMKRNVGPEGDSQEAVQQNGDQQPRITVRRDPDSDRSLQPAPAQGERKIDAEAPVELGVPRTDSDASIFPRAE